MGSSLQVLSSSLLNSHYRVKMFGISISFAILFAATGASPVWDNLRATTNGTWGTDGTWGSGSIGTMRSGSETSGTEGSSSGTWGTDGTWGSGSIGTMRSGSETSGTEGSSSGTWGTDGTWGSGSIGTMRSG